MGKEIGKLEESYKIELVWVRIIGFSVLHIAAVFGVYFSITSAKIATVLFGKFDEIFVSAQKSKFALYSLKLFLGAFLYAFGGLGITAGAHRLWTHRSYKANLTLRLLLTVMNTIAWQVNQIMLLVKPHSRFVVEIC